MRISGRVYSDSNGNGKYDAGEPLLANTKFIVYKIVAKLRAQAARAETKEKLGEFTTGPDGTFDATISGTDAGDKVGLADAAKPNEILFTSTVGDNGYLEGNPQIIVPVEPVKTTAVAEKTTEAPKVQTTAAPSSTKPATTTKAPVTSSASKTRTRTQTTTETKTSTSTAAPTTTAGSNIITSDGTKEKPLCTWNSDCAWDYAAQSKCALAICKASGYTFGTFVNASNSICEASAVDASVWMFTVDTEEYVEGDWGQEAYVTAECSNPSYTGDVKYSDGTQTGPLCTWNSDCAWFVSPPSRSRQSN